MLACALVSWSVLRKKQRASSALALLREVEETTIGGSAAQEARLVAAVSCLPAIFGEDPELIIVMDKVCEDLQH